MDLVQHMLLLTNINLYQPEKCWRCFYIDVELSVFSDIFLHHSPTKLFVQHLCYQTKEKKVYWYFYWCHEAIIDQAYLVKVVPNYRSCSFLCFNPLTLKSDCLLISPNSINPESTIKVMRIQGKDHQLQKILVVQQILFVNTLRNVWRTLSRICILIFRWEGLMDSYRA